MSKQGLSKQQTVDLAREIESHFQSTFHSGYISPLRQKARYIVRTLGTEQDVRQWGGSDESYRAGQHLLDEQPV